MKNENNNIKRKAKMKEDDITDLIGDIKKSYNKSNLSDITTDSLSKTEATKRIGYLLKNSANLSNRDFSINFDPIECQILKKFVSEETMNKRIVLRAEDYFKGIIFTKYVGISYLSLMGKEYLMSRSSSDSSEKRFRKNNDPFDDSYIGVKRLNPFYETLGQKIYSMLNSPEVIRNSSGFKGLNDLRALIFVDCLMPYIEHQGSKKEISELLDSGKYYNASIKAMNFFSREASLKSMEEYMKAVAEKSQVLDPDLI